MGSNSRLGSCYKAKDNVNYTFQHYLRRGLDVAMVDPDVHSPSTQVNWPGTLSAQAKAELTQVLTECARVCRDTLHSFQAWRPFGLARRRAGGLSFCGGDFIPDGIDDPVSYLYDRFVGTSAYYASVAIVHDVQADANLVIRIYIEHVDGGAFRVWIPWRRLEDDNVRLQEPVIESTKPLLWSASG
jgi:hypothetical protein